jgi:putative sigma-54 modulation protein
MNLTMRSHHTTLDETLREHAEKKLARLERYLPRLGDIVVEVERQETRSAAHRFGVQITAHAGASILRAEERNADPQAAFDAAAAVLSRQAQRHSKRLVSRHRGPGGKEGRLADGREAQRPAVPRDAGAGDEDESEEYIAGKIVRVKRFEAKPMSAEEALAQMDLLGHDFFLYIDAASSDYALLYKRRDGGFGMLSLSRG